MTLSSLPDTELRLPTGYWCIGALHIYNNPELDALLSSFYGETVTREIKSWSQGLNPDTSALVCDCNYKYSGQEEINQTPKS